LLLVDDSADVVLIIKRLGGRAGCEVMACGDTASAWTVLQEQRPALLLLDLNLPGEGGDVLCRRVRATPALAELKVAWLSHRDRSEDVLRGLTAGVDFLFSKELLGQPDTWIARLGEILSGKNPIIDDLRVIFHQRVLLPRPPREVIDSVNRLLRQPAMRRFAPDVVRELHRQVLNQLGDDPPTWFRPDGLSLDSAVIDLVSTDNVAAFLIALAEVLGRLLGIRDCAPLRGHLIATAHLLCEAHSL
jgi:CheY-like chemotaxis protein